MNIYLIRHAQTTHNAKGKVFSGVSDVPLSIEGIQATKNLAQNQLWKKIECVFVTPLSRTQQTADLLFDKSIKRVIVPELAEMNFGDYEGIMMTPENENEPAFYNWQHNPEKCVFPNGEDLAEHAEKAYQAILDIAENSPYENIAIISHATTIRLILSKIITGNVTCFRYIPCDNGCVTMLNNNKGIKIKYINATLQP